jgi:hypothetical protein
VVVGQLARIADQDQLGPRGSGHVDQAAEGPGADHAGLVDDQGVAGTEGPGPIVQLAQEPGQGGRGDAGRDLEFLGRPGAERSAGDDVAG